MGQTRYPSKSFKSHFSFKVRQHGQQNLYLQYKVYWFLYKMVGTSSFSRPYLCMQSLLQSPPQIQCSTSVNFHLPIPPLFVHKIILTIPTNTHFLSTSSIFHLPIFAYNIPTIYTKNIFLSSVIDPIQAASSDHGASDSCEEWHCFNLSSSSKYGQW